MRILVTGVAGFLGSHLADLLVAEGHHVVGVDNLVTGSERKISQLRDNSRFTFLRHDVCEPLAIDGTVDQIYHLASPASPVAFAKHRVATLRVNSQGTANLLQLACDKGARFLVTSTSEIYGDPTVHPQREDYWGNVNSVGLRSMYEEAKRFAEAATMAYHRECDADTRIVRLFNTYGPRMDLHDGRVVTTFARQALADEPITVHGDGTQTRSLCYVSDTLRGIVAAMDCDFHEPINIGNPEEVSIAQLARDVLEAVPGTRSKLTFEPALAYDARVRKPDISRARQILNWTPQVPRKEGLAKVVQYFRDPPT